MNRPWYLRWVHLFPTARAEQTDFPGFRVDSQNLEVHFLTKLDHVFGLRLPLFRQLGDVT